MSFLEASIIVSWIWVELQMLIISCELASLAKWSRMIRALRSELLLLACLLSSGLVCGGQKVRKSPGVEPSACPSFGPMFYDSNHTSNIGPTLANVDIIGPHGQTVARACYLKQ